VCKLKKHSYEILSGNIVVAIWNNGELAVQKEELMPLYLKRISNADMWLETRAIDSHRANSRLLKKALRLAEKDDMSTVMHVNAATITDNYWIRPLGSTLSYEDVKFSDDYFSNLALHGTYDSFNKAALSKRSKTPELTNIGSFEKCWKLRDGQWWMHKRANHSEMFSELFVYELGKKLGMNMAVYARGNGCIKSLDFTRGAAINLELASSFMGNNINYCDVIRELQTLCPEVISDYIRMIFLDTLVANPDRHTNNFGLLRDCTSGKIFGFAPNYDNNMALIARGYPDAPKSKDILITLFNEVMEQYPEYKNLIPEVTEELIKEVLQTINMRIKSKKIIDFIMKRYEMIQCE